MITPQQNNYIQNINDNKAAKNSKSFLFDFKKGDFNVSDGKLEIIDNLEALKIWIEKVLKTEKFKFKIYDGVDYGISIIELITSDFPLAFVKAEIEREITTTLLKNINIKSVQNFKFERNKRLLNVSFNCNTTFGIIEKEVIF